MFNECKEITEVRETKATAGVMPPVTSFATFHIPMAQVVRLGTGPVQLYICEGDGCNEAMAARQGSDVRCRRCGRVDRCN